MAVSAAVVAAALTGAATAGAATSRSGAAATVRVTVTDAKVTAPTGLEAGAAHFVIVNKGRRKHTFLIDGPGVRKVHTPPIAPGRSTTLNVKLRAGSYMLSLVDPVGLGMASTQWVQVIPAAVVTNTGGTNVVQGSNSSNGMICGGTVTP